MRPVQVAVAGVLVLGAVLWGGCTKTLPATSLTPVVSATPSVAVSTPDLSGTRKDAVDAVLKFRALIDELRQERNPDTSKVATVARGDSYNNWTYTLQDDFVNGELQVGVSTITILATKGGSYSTQWIVTGCIDYSKVDIVSRTTGKSVRTDPPGYRTLKDFTVEQDPKTQAWYVIKDEGTKQC